MGERIVFRGSHLRRWLDTRPLVKILQAKGHSDQPELLTSPIPYLRTKHV